MAMAMGREELDFSEPTRGMAAMRVRILRAELLAGCQLSVFSSPDDGGNLLRNKEATRSLGQRRQEPYYP